ncbi:MAG: DNA mismatch repair protein MutS [Clostridia bacterium]|nr:DNA mismatch repair protein MutS [Clostridia bacterium]
MAEFTPMIKQYLAIKEQNKDSLLFFRLGDFYELFFDDAKIASAELDLVLTGKDCGQEERAPMCGIPYHSSEGYIAKLVAKGFKVSICEQMEDPALAKGLVKREIIRTVSPGTVTEDSMLDDRRSNYIAGIYTEKKTAGIVFIDVSTGEASATGCTGNEIDSRLITELSRYSPAEIIVNVSAAGRKELTSFIKNRLRVRLSVEEDFFDPDKAASETESRFGKDLECPESIRRPLFAAAGGLLLYLKEAKKSDLSYIRKLSVYQEASFMDIGDTAFRNLEISETMLSHSKHGSLLGVMDSTVTGMGSRKLRRWVEKPLMNPAQIVKRQNAVEELARDTVMREELRHTLRSMNDLERLSMRIVYGTASPRDLRALCAALQTVPSLREGIRNARAALLGEVFSGLDPLEEVCRKIDSAIEDDPPYLVRDGGMIKTGYDAEVDRLRYISGHGKEAIAAVEAKERERTGIKNLKVSFNRVFGYYIDVTNSFKDRIPADYIRKQTLVNSERYITEELKNIENDILSADDKLKSLEYNLFDALRKETAAESERIQATADAVSTLDVLLALASNAVNYRYVRPVVDLSDKLEIKSGRHPVVERMQGGELFVPNDVDLDCRTKRVAVITGPNMAGKSTYMRQVALIALMAQTGSFVPAESAHIGVVDRLFTRVGASDDLSSGRSTFMVEMSEVAEILKDATKKSLIILDEIGRGTSTFDGMAIARAVVEYTADPKKIGARTLFATHYHELTALEAELEGVKNYNIAVKKRGDQISFLRKIVPGGADDSYGIEVALLAGIPAAVISRSKEILSSLIENAPNAPKPSDRFRADGDEPEALLSFQGSRERELVEEIKSLSIDTMTPLEAMNALNQFINKAREL